MSVQILSKFLMVSGLCLALVACDSAEERADAYFTSAQELIAAGDMDRAIIELRNVFNILPDHVEARRSMAQLQQARGNRLGAFRQYLRLSELLPKDPDARTALAELAFEGGNMDEFIRHGERAIVLAPNTQRNKVIELALLYRDALAEEDMPAVEAVSARIREMAGKAHDNSMLERLLLDSYLRVGNTEQALVQLDEMIARAPDSRKLYDQRLLLLRQLDDRPAIEAHLRTVVGAFPEDTEAKRLLFQYFMATGAVDQAEVFLREISDPSDQDPIFFISLVQFLKTERGIDVARAELETAIDVNPESDRLRMLLAGFDFENGQRDKAITDLQAILDNAEPSDLTNQIKIAISRMLQATGNEVGAQRLVAEVLEVDVDNVPALKINARQLIEADETDAAIASLRRALDTEPEDEEALHLMADAYLRAGSGELARDFIAQAVEVSGNAPASSLRYAQALRADGNNRAAEDVVLAALRQAPQNEQILTTLGEIYLETDDFGRLEMVISTLRQIESAPARATANQFQTQLLARQQGNTEAMTFLENLAKAADAGLREQMTLLQARLATRQFDAALELAETLVTEDPQNMDRRFLRAFTLSTTGDLTAARSELQQLATEDPSRAAIWRQLYLVTQIEGGAEEANAILEQALAAVPDSPTLLWIRASELEQAGEIDAAIAVYEDLYTRNTRSMVFANNLASLLVTYKEDPKSLDRAWTIARRLRDLDVPAFQDTYGWLSFRRGDVETARPYLEKAAAGLPKDPIVQYHLAEVYAALGLMEDAAEAYQLAVAIASENDPRPQIERARQQLALLQQTNQTPENK